MRLFCRTTLPKSLVNKTMTETSPRHFFEARPHFHQNNYPFLPTYFMSESKSSQPTLQELEVLFAKIAISRKNNAAENERFFKQLAMIKENEKTLLKNHHDAFKAVFYQFTQHWIKIGEVLENVQESGLFDKFEKLHDQLEIILSEKSFNKKALEEILLDIRSFIENIAWREKAVLDNGATTAISCVTLLLNNLHSYVPKIVTQEYSQEKAGYISCKI